MADIALRPLSLGEILDRTFTLYRRNFVLFLGITAVPHLLILAFNLFQVYFMKFPAAPAGRAGAQISTFPSGGTLAAIGIGALVGYVIFMVAYLFSQAGTVYAVSELYLGRTTTISASLSRAWGQLANLFGVSFLFGIGFLIGFICLVIPGFYLACRWIASVPAALLEDLGPVSSLERSYRLTEDNAGRAFLIYLVSIVLTWAASALFVIPFTVGMALSLKDPAMLRMWSGLVQVGAFCARTLVGPILLIATSVFYYDLRVRKEAFDLQLMMHPSGNIPTGTAGVPSMLS
ncbi:MAG TPA: hypothetical protein VKF79_11390 [Candidatus Acidoferrum sp.]|nr:hypothetical protein [Candidatus Acidoferrum sp.]